MAKRPPRSNIDYRIRFSQSLTCLRVNRNLSQADLGSAAGLSRVWINHFEQGRRVPSFFVLIRLARALQCSIDQLVDP